MKKFVVYREALGPDQNEDNQIIISDFRGVIAFVYGLNGPARVATDAPYLGGASDYVGTISLSAPSVSRSYVLPLRVGDTYALPEFEGREVVLSYVPEAGVFTDAVFIVSSEAGIYEAS